MATAHPAAKLLKRIALLLAIAAALPGVACAAVTVSAHDATGIPGGNATISFDFDFGSAVSISTAVFSLDWDPALLTASGGSATYNGAPVDVAAVLSAAGSYEPVFTPASGNFAAIWSALDSAGDPLPPLDLSGQAELSFSFMLSPSFGSTTRTGVSLSVLLADATGNPLDPLSSVAQVSAVPEPAGWALLLAGGVGVAAVVRRRRRPAA